MPLAVFAAVYFTLISVQVVRFDRNLMLIIPPLISWCAGFDVLVSALRARLQPPLRSAIAVLFAVALLVPARCRRSPTRPSATPIREGHPRLDRGERRAGERPFSPIPTARISTPRSTR